jgi:glycosyltransferase involved in cell wall biosynthesis
MNRPDRNILIAIPVYNEENHLPVLLQEILQLYPHISILVVDDGSIDQTENAIRTFSVKCITHEYNRGKGAAILTAVEYARANRYQWLIMLDGDGQHAPSDIKNFIKAIEQNDADIILGNRMNLVKDMPFHRLLSNGTTSVIISLCSGNLRVHDSQCGFRAVRVSCVVSGSYKYKGFQFESELLLRFGKADKRFKEIPIKTIYKNQKSKMNLLNDTLKFIILIVDSFTW